MSLMSIYLLLKYW